MESGRREDHIKHALERWVKGLEVLDVRQNVSDIELRCIDIGVIELLSERTAHTFAESSMASPYPYWNQRPQLFQFPRQRA